ncbi:MAG: hypothetical protein ACREP7_06500 [Lysobacter sp.]
MNTCVCFGMRCRVSSLSVSADTSSDCSAIEFTAWAHDRDTFPSQAEVLQRYRCGDEVATRWRGALAASYGLRLSEIDEGADE